MATVASMKARPGQVALYLVMVLVVLAMFAFLNVDTFLAVRAKNRLQNGGDAAAIAAARRQGELLNEIGRLNVKHVVAALRRDRALCESIVAQQRRLALIGPVDALAKANEAALKNGMEVRDEFSAILRDHVADIRNLYAAGSGNSDDPYPESYPGAWREYAAAIENAISGGLAVGPDNMEFYAAPGSHLLLNRQFYQAIAGMNWCWFHFNAQDAIDNYKDWHEWGEIPFVRGNPLVNSEIFSLHLVAVRAPLVSRNLVAADFAEKKRRLLAMLGDFAEAWTPLEALDDLGLLTDPGQVWFFFDGAEDGGRWGRWFDGLHLAGDDDPCDFPIVGEIRDEYNVYGCAAICRCVGGAYSAALDNETDLTWSAAAKPFGALEDAFGTAMPATSFFGLVLPCFTDVRLVPIDAVGGSSLATADYEWIEHVRKHLPSYLRYGPFGGRSTCYYCRQLVTWENPLFRAKGSNWIKFNSGSCIRATSPGGGHGGTSHGH